MQKREKTIERGIKKRIKKKTTRFKATTHRRKETERGKEKEKEEN